MSNKTSKSIDRAIKKFGHSGEIPTKIPIPTSNRILRGQYGGTVTFSTYRKEVVRAIHSKLVSEQRESIPVLTMSASLDYGLRMLDVLFRKDMVDVRELVEGVLRDEENEVLKGVEQWKEDN